MHLLRRADDCVHRAGAYAFDATDACILVNKRDCFRTGLAKGGIERFYFAPEQQGQLPYGVVAARWTLVDLRLVSRNGHGIGTATGVTTFPALRLRQQGVYGLSNIFFRGN